MIDYASLSIVVTIVLLLVAVILAIYYARQISMRAYLTAEERYSMRKHIENIEESYIKLQQAFEQKEIELIKLKEKMKDLEKNVADYQDKNRFLQELIDKNFIELRNSIAHSGAISEDLLKFLIKYMKTDVLEDNLNQREKRIL